MIVIRLCEVKKALDNLKEREAILKQNYRIFAVTATLNREVAEECLDELAVYVGSSCTGASERIKAKRKVKALPSITASARPYDSASRLVLATSEITGKSWNVEDRLKRLFGGVKNYPEGVR